MPLVSALSHAQSMPLSAPLTKQPRQMAANVLGNLKSQSKGWFDTTSGTIKTDAVADFTLANSEYLTVANGGAAGLCGPSTFTISAWIKIHDVSQYHEIAACFDSAGSQRAFIFRTNVTDGKLHLLVYPNGSGSGAASTTSPSGLATNTLFHVVGRYDGSHLQIFVDGTSVSSSAYTGAVHQSTSAFGVGFRGNGISYFDGNIAMLGYWSRGISDAEVTSLYNSGTPLSYSGLSSDDKQDLVSFWHLNEPSGVRYDAHGSNNLTDNNTVGVDTGWVEYDATEHSAITKWENQAGVAGFADLTRAADSDSPVLSSNKVDFYNAAKRLSSSSGSLTQPCTIIAIVNHNSTGVNDTIVDSFGSSDQILLNNSSSSLANLFAGSSVSGAAVGSGRRIYIATVNGSSSSLEVSGQDKATGDAGSNSMTGLSVGSSYSETNSLNGDIEKLFLVDRLLTEREVASILAL